MLFLKVVFFIARCGVQVRRSFVCRMTVNEARRCTDSAEEKCRACRKQLAIL